MSGAAAMSGRLDDLVLVASASLMQQSEFEATGPGKVKLGVFGHDPIPDWALRIEVSLETFKTIAATFKLETIVAPEPIYG